MYSNQYNKDWKVIESKTGTSQDIYDGWVRSVLTFTLYDTTNIVDIWLYDVKLRANYFLLRPANTDVYYYFKDDSSFMENNFFIPARNRN